MVFFTPYFPSKILYTFCTTSICGTCSACYILLDLFTLKYDITSSSFPLLGHLRDNLLWLLQNIILPSFRKYFQTMFCRVNLSCFCLYFFLSPNIFVISAIWYSLNQNRESTFHPDNNRGNIYSSMYFNLYFIREDIDRWNILKLTVRRLNCIGDMIQGNWCR